MKDIFDYIIREWERLLEAPLLFILVFLLAYSISRWRYGRKIDHLSAERDLLCTERDSKRNEITKIKKKKHLEVSDVKVFEGAKDGGYNHLFYEYFNKKIRESNEVYITGDGFECVNQEGEAIAKAFIESFRIALNKGATVVRIETRSSGRIKWARMLAKLKEDYPDQFKFYILNDANSTQMASVCVIDPNDRNKSIVEMMLSTQRLFGVDTANLAGTAIFIQGKVNLALDLRQRILDFQKSKKSISLDTPSEITNALAGSTFYYAYGSNMSTEQMLKRCPSAEYVDIAILKDHEVVFNRKGSYRDGGVASVKHKKGSDVYGIIWKINLIDLKTLDKIEDLTAYKRSKEKAYSTNGKLYEANVYKAIPMGNFKPDEEYLELIINSAIEQDLPNEYVNYLKKFRKHSPNK